MDAACSFAIAARNMHRYCRVLLTLVLITPVGKFYIYIYSYILFQKEYRDIINLSLSLVHIYSPLIFFFFLFVEVNENYVCLRSCASKLLYFRCNYTCYSQKKKKMFVQNVLRPTKIPARHMTRDGPRSATEIRV